MIQSQPKALEPLRARRASFAARAAALLVGIGAANGCSSYERAPVPFRIPTFRIDAGYETVETTVASAPDGGALLDEEDPIPMRVRVLYLERGPEDSAAIMSAAASEASAAFNSTGAEPVVDTPLLTASLLYATGDGAMRWIEGLSAVENQFLAVDERVWLVPGANYRTGIGTMAFIENRVDWLNEFPDRGPIPRRVGVVLTPDAGETTAPDTPDDAAPTIERASSSRGPAVAIEVTDIDPIREAAIVQEFLESPDVLPGAPRARQDEAVRRETLFVNAAPAPGVPVVLTIDSPFANGTGAVCAFIIERLAPSEVTHSVNDARALVEEARMARAVHAEPLTEETRKKMERAEALREFQARGGRPSLLLLAEEADAPLATDLALVADESFLVEWSRAAFPPERSDEAESGITAFGESVAADSIAWSLEAGAWRALARGALDETLRSGLRRGARHSPCPPSHRRWHCRSDRLRSAGRGGGLRSRRPAPRRD